MIAVSNVLPLPNPPLVKGRELDFYCFSPCKGERGVKCDENYGIPLLKHPLINTYANFPNISPKPNKIVTISIGFQGIAYKILLNQMP